MELEKVRYQIELEVQRRLTEELKGKEFNQMMGLFTALFIGAFLGIIVGAFRY